MALNPETPPFHPGELVINHEVPPPVNPAVLLPEYVPVPKEAETETINMPACSSPRPAACKPSRAGQSPSPNTLAITEERPDSDDEDFYIECFNPRCAYSGLPAVKDPTVHLYRCTLCTGGVVVCDNCIKAGAHKGHSPWLVLEDT